MSSNKIVKASELLAAAAAAKGDKAIHYKHDDLSYDLGLMAAFDSHPIDPKAYAADPEAALLATAVGNAQLLVKKIFEQPVTIGGKEDGDEAIGPVAELPDRITRLPRWKPVPKPKPLTRWEKFALQKGIKKKAKQSRMVWDEQAQEWKPRWGYKRANDDTNDWAIPVKTGEDAFADPWEQRKLKKRDRVLTNQLNAVANAQRASKAEMKKKFGETGAPSSSSSSSSGAPAVLPGASVRVESGKKGGAGSKSGSGAIMAPKVHVATDAVGGGKAAGLPAGVPARIAPRSGMGRDADAIVETAGGRSAKRRRMEESGAERASSMSRPVGRAVKEERSVKAERLKAAQVSTASLGRFDASVSGEPAKPKDKRKLKRLPNEMPAKDESRRNSDILRKILGGSGEGEKAAAGGIKTSGGGGGGGGGSKQLSGNKRKRPGK